MRSSRLPVLLLAAACSREEAATGTYAWIEIDADRELDPGDITVTVGLDGAPRDPPIVLADDGTPLPRSFVLTFGDRAGTLGVRAAAEAGGVRYAGEQERALVPGGGVEVRVRLVAKGAPPADGGGGVEPAAIGEPCEGPFAVCAAGARCVRYWANQPYGVCAEEPAAGCVTNRDGDDGCGGTRRCARLPGVGENLCLPICGEGGATCAPEFACDPITASTTDGRTRVCVVPTCAGPSPPAGADCRWFAEEVGDQARCRPELGVCQTQGADGAAIGDDCASPTQCPANAACFGPRENFSARYCTRVGCNFGGPFPDYACGEGSVCVNPDPGTTHECLVPCDPLTAPCARDDLCCCPLPGVLGLFCLPPSQCGGSCPG